ncbi:helix-turn-helix domain-containing protein [Roseicyclus persicicus]|uniref:Helix-turn-helix transcriptional regulator n=1 Tax=Roseicyclus persicicus TaxID=2650661 RepID=A0A7X6H0W6_9RHOB|nr:helix-turn-helix domain-containing protein [Roseibacterium persicicum]NKX44767.1 helix-turn-helix transcriptional regulator [Roseibacterium persicicum]
MTEAAPIPVFTLFGETAPFPDILHVERIADRAPALGWTIAPHRHGQLAQLLLIETGAAAAMLDGAALDLGAGAFLYVPPGVVHGYGFRPGSTGHVVTLTRAVLASAAPGAPGLAAALARPRHGAADDRLVQLVRLLSDSFGDTGRFRAQAVLGLAQALLARLAETAEGGGPGAAADPRLARLDALIAAQMAEGWQAADYAAALSVSTGHLSRLCRAARGVGAKAYIEQAVMEEACRLLAFTTLPAAGIGYRLGFDDPSHFSKRFRAARGLSPTEYRRTLEGRGAPARPEENPPPPP